MKCHFGYKEKNKKVSLPKIGYKSKNITFDVNYVNILLSDNKQLLIKPQKQVLLKNK